MATVGSAVMAHHILTGRGGSGALRIRWGRIEARGPRTPIASYPHGEGWSIYRTRLGLPWLALGLGWSRSTWSRCPPSNILLHHRSALRVRAAFILPSAQLLSLLASVYALFTSTHAENMSTLARSQSTPHVPSREAFFSHAASSSHAPPRLSRPKIPRHRSAFALSESTPSAASSGHHTPLAERVEDPFSLSGFFSPGLAVTDPPSDSTWHWLRGDNDETGVDAESRYMASGCVSPISEEDAERLDGLNSSLSFERLLDKLADEMIREEDKMGVLSLRECSLRLRAGRPI